MAGDEQQVEPQPMAARLAAIGPVHPHGVTAFEEMVREHSTALHRTAFRLTHDWGAAEDLVQETLERAYRAFDHYRPEGASKEGGGWFMTANLSFCRFALEHLDE